MRAVNLHGKIDHSCRNETFNRFIGLINNNQSLAIYIKKSRNIIFLSKILCSIVYLNLNIYNRIFNIYH